MASWQRWLLLFGLVLMAVALSLAGVLPGGEAAKGGVAGLEGAAADSCGQTQCHPGFEAFSTSVEVPAEVEPGSRFTYSLTVTNGGDHQLRDVDASLDLERAPHLALAEGEEAHQEGPDIGAGGSHTFNWELEAVDFGENRLEETLAATAYYNHLNPLADDEERYTEATGQGVEVKALTLALDHYRLEGLTWRSQKREVELTALQEVRDLVIEVDPALKESLTVSSPEGDWQGGFATIPAGEKRTISLEFEAREGAEGEVRLRWQAQGEAQTTAIAVTIKEVPPPNDDRLVWFWLGLGLGLAALVLKVRPKWDPSATLGGFTLRGGLTLELGLGLLTLALLVTTLQRADMVPRRWTLLGLLGPLLLGGVAATGVRLAPRGGELGRGWGRKRLEPEALERAVAAALLLMGAYLFITAYTKLNDFDLNFKDWTWLGGRILGLTNLGLVGASVVLGLKWTTRRRWLKGRLRLLLHQAISVAVVVVGLTHGALLVVGTFQGTWFGLLSGGLTTLAFLGLGLSGAYQKILVGRYGYKGWQTLHRWLALFAVAFALEHALINGTDLAWLRPWD